MLIGLEPVVDFVRERISKDVFCRRGENIRTSSFVV